MDKLLEVLLAAKLDKKPTVDELAKLAGVEKVTGAERDEAWDKYQAKLAEDKAIADAQAKADADAAAAKDQAKKDADKAPSGKNDKAAYKVTVKRDGFRRCGRAWVGTTELKASDVSAEELKILKADPMFVVVEL